jgi:AcrR family transcriptional regulator
LHVDRSVKSCWDAGVAEEERAPDRILEAAEQLFSARGYSGVSVRDVAERAEVKKASVFYHFGSKPELFQRVLDRYYTAHARVLEAAAGDGRDVRDGMHRLLDAYLDFIEDNHRWVRLVQLASGGEALPRIQQGLGELLAKLTALLGDRLPASGPLAARQFFVTFSGIVNTYYVYAPVLGEMWDDDVNSARARRERREHVHWVADALLDKLEVARRH